MEWYFGIFNPSPTLFNHILKSKHESVKKSDKNSAGTVSLNWLEMNATPKSFKCFGTMQKHLWGKFEQYKRNGLIFYHSLDTTNRHIFEGWLAEIGKQFE
jgi:hypothetical protein